MAGIYLGMWFGKNDDKWDEEIPAKPCVSVQELAVLVFGEIEKLRKREELKQQLEYHFDQVLNKIEFNDE